MTRCLTWCLLFFALCTTSASVASGESLEELLGLVVETDLPAELERLRLERVWASAESDAEARREALDGLLRWSALHDDRVALVRMLSEDLPEGPGPFVGDERRYALGLAFLERGLSGVGGKKESVDSFAAAVYFFSGVEGEDLRFVRARYLQGVANAHLSMNRSAAKDWRSVVEFADDFSCSGHTCVAYGQLASLSIVNIGNLYYSTGKYGDAESYYGVLDTPSHLIPEALLGLSSTYLAMGEWREAGKAARRLIEHPTASMALRAEAELIRTQAALGTCQARAAVRWVQQFEVAWTPVYGAVLAFEAQSADEKLTALRSGFAGSVLPAALARDLMVSRDLQILAARLRRLSPAQPPAGHATAGPVGPIALSETDEELLRAERVRAGQWALEILDRDLARFRVKLEELAEDMVDAEALATAGEFGKLCRKGGLVFDGPDDLQRVPETAPGP